jgi:hypothetical protein
LHAHTNKTTNDVALMQFVSVHLEELAYRLFSQNWMSICQIQRSRYHFLKTLALIQPTLAIRAALNNQHIVAKSSGHFLSVWNCIDIYEYEQISVNDKCYEEVPIVYKYNGHNKKAFLRLADQEIVHVGTVRDCSRFPAQYVLMHGNENHLWNGRNFSIVELTSHDVVFTDNYPARRDFYLTAAKVHDPHEDQFNRLTQLLDVDNAVRSLVKLFEITATDADVNMQQLAELATAAGMDSAKFVQATLSRVAKMFYPPSWLIVLIVMIIATIIIAIVTYTLLRFARECGCRNNIDRPHGIEAVVLSDLNARDALNEMVDNDITSASDSDTYEGEEIHTAVV